MKKIGLFYATKAERTSWVAEKIQKEFGERQDQVRCLSSRLARMILLPYDCFIVGNFHLV